MVQTRKITRWARAAADGDPAQIRGGYRLDGTPLPGSDYFSIFFAAPLAVAAMTDAEHVVARLGARTPAEEKIRPPVNFGGYSPISSWIFASNWSSGGGFCR